MTKGRVIEMRRQFLPGAAAGSHVQFLAARRIRLLIR